jgi:hypothetical protein
MFPILAFTRRFGYYNYQRWVMTALKGHIRNDAFISDDGSVIPDGSRVMLTVLEGDNIPPVSEAERQRRVWADFFEAMENEPEKLSPEFDQIIAKGIKFREVDFS